MQNLHVRSMQNACRAFNGEWPRGEDVSPGGGGTAFLLQTGEDSPVDIGVQQHGRVLGQLGQMHHLGFQLRSLRFVHPHVR